MQTIDWSVPDRQMISQPSTLRARYVSTEASAGRARRMLLEAFSLVEPLLKVLKPLLPSKLTHGGENLIHFGLVGSRAETLHCDRDPRSLEVRGTRGEAGDPRILKCFAVAGDQWNYRLTLLVMILGNTNYCRASPVQQTFYGEFAKNESAFQNIILQSAVHSC